MHILFISDNFYPESNASANRLYDHAQVWHKAGHQVTVLTCAPNFPVGKIFPGYRNQWRSVENLDGITVIRIKSYITPNQGTIKRLLDYISFAIHAAIQGLFVQSPDVVIATSPQPFPIFSAWWIARLKRKPFVFEIRDLWPESVIAVEAMKRESCLIKFFNWAIKRMYHSADVIVSVTDSFKQILIQQEKVKPEKIIICKNGCDLQKITVTEKSTSLRKKYGLENTYLVGYVGTIGLAHHIDTVIQAAARNHHQHIHFVIMGNGAEALAAKEAALHLQNLTFIEGGSREDAYNVMNMLDAVIVHLKDTPLFKTVIPSKIFEIMALGKPILMGVKGESRKIVIDKARAGIAFEPSNPIDLNRAIAELPKTHYDSDQVTAFVQKYYDREKLAIKMLKDISQCLKKSNINGKS